VQYSKTVDRFSLGDVVKFSGVKSRTLDHWAPTGFLKPSIKRAAGTGSKRVYGFSDVVAARVANDLRSAGVSLQALRKVVRQLQKMNFAYPLTETCLIISGKEVYLRSNEGLMALLQRPGQTHFLFTAMNLGQTVELLLLKTAESRLLAEASSTGNSRRLPTSARQRKLKLVGQIA
jgi:DNA-binding transcriptional MerR regulator